MEELLIIAVQFLFELALNILANIPFDWPSKNRRTPEPERIAGWCFFWFALACAVGWLSTFILPHTLLRSPGLRLANTLLSPFVSAYLSRYVATRRRVDNQNIIPRNHFWQGFWFTLGFVLIRFAYANRN
jgi:hypothetical protein